MQMIPVHSSNISAIGYEQVSCVLCIEFISGGTYNYFDVPEYLYNLFMNANSIGIFFDQNIKHNFRYQKVS